ncbi:MAG: hypothetical protein KBA53_13015 [Thermoclostridium sp.]|nr:hypothetical protein [Thermoclostridium sp.]
MKYDRTKLDVKGACMLYWSELSGASVYVKQKWLGQIENVMLEPELKVVSGFILERRNRDIRHRYISFGHIRQIKRDRIDMKETMELKTLSKVARKKTILAGEFLKQSVVDDKGEWIGRVADFSFDPSNGFVRDMILSGSLLEDLWNGRKRMPVLSQVEFSQEFISIDQETREEISGLQKGLKKWLGIDFV